MFKNFLKIGVVIVVLVIIAVSAFMIKIYIEGGSGEASEEISAPTLVPRTAVSTTAAPGATQAATEVAQAATEAAPGAAQAATEAPPGAASAASPTVGATNTTAAAATTDLQFRIVPEESEVRFTLQEDLSGVRTTVVGRTDQVAGDILIDRVNPSNSVIGTIRINMRTLVTDQEMRNRMIRGEILESAKDEYEFSDFVPKAVEGMPASVEVGTPFTFSVIGDLTIREITQEITFVVEVSPVSETRIEGHAQTTVTRAQFELEIPRVPQVANVTDEVLLEIEFVAAKVEQ